MIVPLLSLSRQLSVFKGCTDGEDDAEGGQERHPPSGVEEDAGVAQSHSGAPAAACRKSPGSPGPGKTPLLGRLDCAHWQLWELRDEILSGTFKVPRVLSSRRGPF